MSIFYNIKKAILSWVADIRFYWGGIILFGDSHYKIKGPHMRKILDNLEPGDILLRRYSHYLGSVTIPGYWSHSAIYVGDNKVIHMLGDGVTTEDILSFMRCDDIAILRLRSSDPILISKATKLAKHLMTMKVEYDYDFHSSCPKRFYCTEFCNYVYDSPIFKSGIIYPDDMLTSIWEMVWNNE